MACKMVDVIQHPYECKSNASFKPHQIVENECCKDLSPLKLSLMYIVAVTLGNFAVNYGLLVYTLSNFTGY